MFIFIAIHFDSILIQTAKEEIVIHPEFPPETHSSINNNIPNNFIEHQLHPQVRLKVQPSPKPKPTLTLQKTPQISTNTNQQQQLQQQQLLLSQFELSSVLSTIYHDLCSVDNTLHISYMIMPKAGSSTIRSYFQHEKPITDCPHNKTYFQFTILREPLSRMISAYSTIVKRLNIVLKYRNGSNSDNNNNNNDNHSPKTLLGLPVPSAKEGGEIDLDGWRKHFNDQVTMIIDLLIAEYDNTIIDGSIEWDSHLLRIGDLMKGHKFDYIGCMYDNEPESLNNELKIIANITNIAKFSKPRLKNVYEHAKDIMPQNKNDFMAIEYLQQETIDKIVRFYHDDIELFETFCGN